MNKEFIPYEQALELKELGFDEECIAYWTRGLDGYYIEYKHYTNKHWMFTANDHKDRDKMCTAPLYQQAFRWFREKYDIYPIIEAKNYFKSPIKWIYSTCNVNGSFEVGFTNHSTYEKTELACLIKLIEIAKNK